MGNSGLAEVAKDSQDFILNNKDTFVGFESDVIDGDKIVYSIDKNERCSLVVTDDTTYDAFVRISDDSNKVGILNFASAKHPGGGFIMGSMAQEESLCYVSNLYNAQLETTGFYGEPLNNSYYTNKMIVSRNITFFKDKRHSLLDKYLVCPVVITSAAVNCSPMIRYGKLDKAKVSQVMTQRILGIIKQFAVEGCDNIVLGAFGCWVLRIVHMM